MAGTVWPRWFSFLGLTFEANRELSTVRSRESNILKKYAGPGNTRFDQDPELHRTRPRLRSHQGPARWRHRLHRSPGLALLGTSAGTPSEHLRCPQEEPCSREG